MNTVQKGAGILLVGASVGFFYATSLSSAPKPVQRIKQIPQPAQVEELHSIEFSGTVESKLGQKVSLGRQDAASLAKVLVKPNDKVKKGQVLATISLATGNPRPMPKLYSQSEAASAEQLSNALGQALTDHESDVQLATKALAEAKENRQRKVGAAEAEVSRISGESAKNAIAAAQKELDQAQAAYDKAKKLSERDAHAYEEGWIARNQATASRQAFEAREVDLQRAQTNFSAAKSGSTDAEIEQAKAKLAAIKATEDRIVEDAQKTLNAVRDGGLSFRSSTSIPSGVFAIPPKGSFKGRFARISELRAPMDGVVISILDKTSKSLVELSATEPITECVALVDLQTAGKLRQGTIVTVNGSESGSIGIIDQADPKTGLSRIHINLTGTHKVGDIAQVSVKYR